MSGDWEKTTLNNEDKAFEKLIQLSGRRWLCRGQLARHRLVPSIDRPPLDKYTRLKKLTLERQSIDIYRSTARFFTHDGEKNALHDEIIALAVLRHYGVPTRLLDWSLSPFVAAYFACEDRAEDGAIWSFDLQKYEQNGKEQWRKWPETTTDGGGAEFKAQLTAFKRRRPPNWFCCVFYPAGFPRQYAQIGAYSLTARFGRDHAKAIADLLKDKSLHHLYVIPKRIKAAVLKRLRDDHGVWRGSLFPDSAGAAETAKAVFPARPCAH